MDDVALNEHLELANPPMGSGKFPLGRAVMFQRVVAFAVSHISFLSFDYVLITTKFILDHVSR